MRRLVGVLFYMMLAFFAGVIATLVVLAPGDRRLGDILQGRDSVRQADFNLAADRVESLGDKAVMLAYRAKEHVSQLMAKQ